MDDTFHCRTCGETFWTDTDLANQHYKHRRGHTLITTCEDGRIYQWPPRITAEGFEQITFSYVGDPKSLSELPNRGNLYLVVRKFCDAQLWIICNLKAAKTYFEESGDTFTRIEFVEPRSCVPTRADILWSLKQYGHTEEVIQKELAKLPDEDPIDINKVSTQDLLKAQVAIIKEEQEKVSNLRNEIKSLLALLSETGASPDFGAKAVEGSWNQKIGAKIRDVQARTNL